VSTDEFRLPFVRGTLVEPEPFRDRDPCDLPGLERHARESTKPIAIDLFCGAGGLSLGLREAGFDVILGVDHASDAVATHRSYFGGVSHLADLSDEEEVGKIVRSLASVKVDLIAGGPPCQPFSRANVQTRSKQNGTEKKQDDRAGLWKTFLSVIEQVQPRAVLFENVPDLAFSANAHVFMEIVVALEDLGYSVHARILNSSDYGVAQQRQRLFIVAVEKGIDYTWPLASQNGATLADAIKDLPTSSDKTLNPTRYEPSTRPSELLEWLRSGVRPDEETIVYDHTARRVRKDDLKIYKRMKEGQIYDDVVPAGDPLRRYGKEADGNFKDRYKRLAWDEVCRSITAHISKDGYWYVHPEQHRTLTVREAARVQSFPDWFRFYGYPTAGFKQIGNSVPPLLGKALGKELLAALEKQTGQVTRDAADDRRDAFASTGERCTGPGGPSSSDVYSVLESIDFIPEEASWSPWLYSTDPWLLTLGIVFADQVEGVTGFSPRNRRLRAWTRACNSWPTPGKYVIRRDNNNLPDDGPREATTEEDLVQSFGPLRISGEEIGSALQKIAEWRIGDPGEDFVKGIDRHVPPRFKNEISSLLIDYNWSRLPNKSGPMRVADRLYGYGARGTGAHSRLNLARALARARDRRAWIALCEIADLYCHPPISDNQGGTKKPECFLCPLNTVCVSRFSEPVANQMDPLF
jgi:DNA (cytosine-5)-methyltransferase 1